VRAGNRARPIVTQAHPRKEDIMRFLAWLRSEDRSDPADRRRGHGPSRRRAAVRPRLQLLEDRRVLSTLIVGNNLDGTFDGSTLRNEIAAAQPGDTIVFSGLNGQTITLAQGQLEINKSLTIQGPGADQLAVSGNGAMRVFRVDAGANVTISGLTIEQGDAHSAPYPKTSGDFTPDRYDGAGGGILNLGTLSLSGCTVTRNFTATSFAGAYWGNPVGGGIYNGGTMTLSGCTVTGNTAYDYLRPDGLLVHSAGGGIFNDSQGNLTIVSSVVQNNTAPNGADICDLGSMKINHSSIGTISKKL
jgi:hypothetical protein